MSQPVTHYLITQDAMQKILPGLWQQYSDYAGFGSFSPDMFYVKDLIKSKITRDGGFGIISDIIHAVNSRTFFTRVLERIKKLYSPGTAEYDKARAFTYGFYSHVIADCIFHPYVYRFTQDHWKFHDSTEAYNAHKKLESLIDNCMLAVKGMGHEDFCPKVGCGASDDDDKLDATIADLVFHGIKTAYQYDLDFDAYFARIPLESKDHPIHAAYNDYVSSFWTASKGIQYVGFNINELISKHGITRIKSVDEWMPAEEKAMNINENPWFPIAENNLLRYTVQHLYNNAVETLSAIIQTSEQFFASEAADSFEYFLSQSKIPYLIGDYNLDTGLPSSDNEVESNCSREPNVRFAYGVDKLVAIYG
jgi:hypothetical protein